MQQRMATTNVYRYDKVGKGGPQQGGITRLFKRVCNHKEMNTMRLRIRIIAKFTSKSTTSTSKSTTIWTYVHPHLQGVLNIASFTKVEVTRGAAVSLPTPGLSHTGAFLHTATR